MNVYILSRSLVNATAFELKADFLMQELQRLINERCIEESNLMEVKAIAQKLFDAIQSVDVEILDLQDIRTDVEKFTRIVGMQINKVFFLSVRPNLLDVL